MLIVHIAEVAACVVAFFGGLACLGAVELRDLVQGQPAGDQHVAPFVGIVGFGVRIRNHIHGIKVADHDVALDVVVEAHPNIEVAALLDDTIAENLCLVPVQVAHVHHLHGHFGEDRGPVQVSISTTRLEGDVHPVVDLVADGRVDAGLDLVELVAGAALLGELGTGLGRPLPSAAHVHILAACCVRQVVQVATILGVLVTRPVLACGLIAYGSHGGVGHGHAVD